jgi:aminoglycoside phosphotransferase family enzyme/predicted kinase
MVNSHSRRQEGARGDALAAQGPVFAFLSNPATHGGSQVRRIDTHAASVFLAGARAFKVKRAVKFPFLDFSTLEKRKSACEAEIKVNRPFAPQIYQGVVAITREPDGSLALGGGGTPIEWAVKMHRFDETSTLDHLADQGRIDAALADALGRVVAAAHSGATPVDPQPWIAAMGAYIEEHEAEFAKTPEIFPPAEVEALTRLCNAAYARLGPLLIERGREGFICGIHGDLHLGNIVLIDGQPVLFDAIEFSPLIASGDTFYDLAFLLMDLIERGLSPAANIVLNRYLAWMRRSENLDALAALPFYLSMRAAIRAKVTAERREQARSGDQAAIGQSAAAYFRLARALIEPPRPVLVAIGGLSGTGKSVLARALAPALGPPPGAVVLRSDVARKALFDQDESAKLPAEAYAPSVTSHVYGLIAADARHAAAAGHAAIMDAVFAKPAERLLAQQSAASLGVPFRGLFLEAPLASRLERVGSRRRDASDADASIAREQESYQIGNVEGAGWRRIDAAGSPEETLARARDALR